MFIKNIILLFMNVSIILIQILKFCFNFYFFKISIKNNKLDDLKKLILLFPKSLLIF